MYMHISFHCIVEISCSSPMESFHVQGINCSNYMHVYYIYVIMCNVSYTAKLPWENLSFFEWEMTICGKTFTVAFL